MYNNKGVTRHDWKKRPKEHRSYTDVFKQPFIVLHHNGKSKCDIYKDTINSDNFKYASSYNLLLMTAHFIKSTLEIQIVFHLDLSPFQDKIS